MRLGKLGRLLIFTAAFAIVQGSQRTRGAALATEADATGTHAHAAHQLVSAPRTGIAAYLLSPGGRQILRASHHPMAIALLRRSGEQPTSASVTLPSEAPATDTTAAIAQTAEASIGCGSASGTRFNLEPRVPPNALPQDSTVVDFLPGAGVQGADLVVGAANDFRGFFGALGDSATGYYVHRSAADANPCTPDFEGGLPQIIDRATGEALLGGGDPVVEADPTRNAIYIADSRIGQASSTIALFRASAANLNSSSACPDGTHSASSAKSCWPRSVEVNPSQANLNLSPHIAVDSRAKGNGVGAADIYISGTLVTPLAGDLIFIAACKNDLSACSPGVVISGADSAADSSHVRIRPDIATKASGSVSVSYVNIREGTAPDFLQTFDIKYVTCTPAGAPSAPTCASPKLITSETQPVPSKGGGLGGGSLSAAQFMIATFPKHDHRQDQSGVETYVVWDRCKVALVQGGDVCPDADVVLAASKNNGQTWQFGNVDIGAGDQYFPWIVTDTSTNIINIAYYSTIGDKMNHRGKVLLTQILPGPLTPDPVTPAQILTSTAMEPSGDFFLRNTYIGNRIGVSARATPGGSRAYVHYMHNIVNGIYNGVPAPEQNNHLSQFNY